MRFKVISTITNIQVIVKGTGVDIRQHLNCTYAGGRKVNWRKLKGIAIVEYVTANSGRSSYTGLKRMALDVAMKRISIN